MIACSPNETVIISNGKAEVVDFRVNFRERMTAYRELDDTPEERWRNHCVIKAEVARDLAQRELERCEKELNELRGIT